MSDPEDPFESFVDSLKSPEEQLVFDNQADLDADGTEERVFALGNSFGISKVFVVRSENGNIVTFGGNLAGGGYGVDEVKLISLEDSPKKYIWCELTNGAGLRGFQLFELSDKEPKQIAYSASATGSGEDELLDGDGDGLFDGYVQNRSAYDVLFYQVNRRYEWKNGEFVWSGTSVDLPAFQENTIQEVARQYLNLRVFDSVPENKSTDAAERLVRLRARGASAAPDLDTEIWMLPVQEALLGIGDGLRMTVQQEDQTAEVTFTAIHKGKQDHLVLELILEDKQWKVQKETSR